MNLLTILPLGLFVIGNAILALVIIINNPKSWTNRLFSLLIFVLTIYLVINSYLTLVTDHDLALLLSRAIISLGAVINLVVFLFLDTFPEPKITFRKGLFYISLLLTVFLFFAGFTGLIFANVSIINGAAVPSPGPLIPIFLGHTVVFILGGLIEIFLRYRKAQGVERSRIQFILFSFLTLFTLIIIFNFVITVFFKFGNFVPLLPVYLLIFNMIVTYSIIRHRLLDIRLFVARSIGYVFTVAVIGSIYSLGFFLVETFVFQTPVSSTTILISVTFILLITFSFQVIRRAIEKVTERIFYKHSYDRQQLLEHVTHIMAATLGLNEITQKVMEKLKQEMQISSLAVLLLKDKKIDFFQRVGTNQDHTSEEEQAMVKLAETAFNQVDEKILILEEVTDPDVRELMRKYGYHAISALIVENQLLGGLFLNEKSDGTIFSTQDIEVLKILAPEFAVAVNNSLSYEEISKFNITLKEEIHKATEELEHANIRLKELDELKNEFVSVASHELRTPMTAIKSYLWLAVNQPPSPLDPVIKNYLNIAYSSTERLIHLVGDMLTISRIEGNRFELNKVNTNLCEIVQAVYNELKISADEKHVDLTIENPYGDIFIFADKDKIREVVQNIVGNALKFTPDNGKVALIFERKEEKGKKVIWLKVQDTGPGIRAEDVPKLFHKFNRLEHSYQQVKGGSTGLGLYIAKQIINLHNGDITVESEIGKGSTFMFSLPEVSADYTEAKPLSPKEDAK